MKIGFDLIDYERLKDDEKFLSRIANKNEIDYIKKFKNFKEKIGALWAVKEAVIKALDLGGTGVSFLDIELCHTETGKPFVRLFNKCSDRFIEIKGKEIEVSISHIKGLAGAVAIINTFE